MDKVVKKAVKNIFFCFIVPPRIYFVQVLAHRRENIHRYFNFYTEI